MVLPDSSVSRLLPSVGCLLLSPLLLTDPRLRVGGPLVLLRLLYDGGRVFLPVFNSTRRYGSRSLSCLVTLVSTVDRPLYVYPCLGTLSPDRNGLFRFLRVWITSR